MSTRKPLSIATKLAATFAVVALSLSAFAGRYWVAADGSDAKWSNTANWSDQKDGTPGATEPGDGTGTIYFCKYNNGATIFDKLGVGPGNVQIGTQDERTKFWLFALCTVVPFVTSILGIVPKLLWPLSKTREAQMYQELAVMRDKRINAYVEDVNAQDASVEA